MTGWKMGQPSPELLDLGQTLTQKLPQHAATARDRAESAASRAVSHVERAAFPDDAAEAKQQKKKGALTDALIGNC